VYSVSATIGDVKLAGWRYLWKGSPDQLRVWFRCLFVSSERTIKIMLYLINCRCRSWRTNGNVVCENDAMRYDRRV